MATRNRQHWKLDSQGEYARQVGWKHSRNGKLIQHKFRLGADLKEAKRREQKLLELWGQVEKDSASLSCGLLSPSAWGNRLPRGSSRSNSPESPTTAPKPTLAICTVCNAITRWCHSSPRTRKHTFPGLPQIARWCRSRSGNCSSRSPSRKPSTYGEETSARSTCPARAACCTRRWGPTSNGSRRTASDRHWDGLRTVHARRCGRSRPS